MYCPPDDGIHHQQVKDAQDSSLALESDLKKQLQQENQGRLEAEERIDYLEQRCNQEQADGPTRTINAIITDAHGETLISILLIVLLTP
jgi:hypothetical protein